ncbi:Type 1 glutamine amidotransferase-like domain-containing protein [Filibacter tadaridae]|uniref:Putative peptidase n=1 Tax=Filibacter tadaridae TaxID=2483811 RepID=A0A3P5XGH8_9BACL|nr:Type 1 glutamine amidotransferase-like domain-containing protein [Filibacter tadaridae]VDC33895.1 putative peptidase [Filibacter tadaridae]
MGNVFLTSNGFCSESIKKVFLRHVKENLSNPKAVIITTASPYKENNKYAIKAKSDLIEMGIDQVDFLDVEYENPTKLQQYNIVYINGGNPFNLLHHIKKSKAESILKDLAKQSVIFVGVSAGAVVLGPSIEVVNYFTPAMNNTNMVDFTALSITEKAIFPHYDREDIFQDSLGKTIEERLNLFEEDNNCSIIRLTDEEYLLIDV